MLGRRLTILAVALAMTASACGAPAAIPAGGTPAAAPTGGSPATAPTGGAAPTAPAPAKTSPAALKHITLQWAWLASAYHAPFVLARDKGFYRDAGLDVSLVEGKGGTLAVDQVAKGGPVFSVIAVSAVIVPLSKGAPVKVVATYVHKSQMSFTYHQGFDFTSPRQLAGKTVIGTAGGIPTLMLPAVLGRYGVKEDQVKVQMAPPNAYGPLFAKNPDAVVLGLIGDYTNVLQVDPTAQEKLYADFGVNLYDTALITNNQMIRDHPDEVAAFVAASSRGWQYALAHPQEALDDLDKDFPDAKPAAIAENWKLLQPLINTSQTEGHPLGWMSASEWQDQLDLLHRYGGLEKVLPLDDYYTNRFITEDKANQ